MTLDEMQNLIVQLDRAIFQLSEVLKLDEPGEGSLMTISEQRTLMAGRDTLRSLRSDYQEAFDVNLANEREK